MNLTLFNNSNNLNETDHTSLSEGEIVVVIIVNTIFLGSTVWQLTVIAKLVHKHRYKMEPVHILEMSMLLNLASYKIFSFYGLGSLEVYVREFPVYCYMVNFVQYYSRICFYGDSCASQINMFLMIHLNTYYKEDITTNHALVSTAIVKVPYQLSIEHLSRVPKMPTYQLPSA